MYAYVYVCVCLYYTLSLFHIGATELGSATYGQSVGHIDDVQCNGMTYLLLVIIQTTIVYMLKMQEYNV